MKRIPAVRRHDPAQYELTKYWYYHYPDLRCVFRADTRVTFNPEQHVEELTVEEYADLYFKYRRDLIKPFVSPTAGKTYYYCNSIGDVFKSGTPVNIDDEILELEVSEYIALSLAYDLNHDDTCV